jgi:HPt (histidine-containing phosphotransfer) domain-containing protein
MTSQSWALPDDLRQLAETGEEDLVKEVLAVFQSDTTERLTKLRNGLAGNDRGVVKSQAHAIKGSAGQVGAMRVAAICQSIESGAPTAGVADLQDLVRQLESAFAEVSRAMSA